MVPLSPRRGLAGLAYLDANTMVSFLGMMFDEGVVQWF